MTGTAVGAPPNALAPVTEDFTPRPSTPPNTLATWLRRPLVACLLLLAVYASLSLVLNDPGGTLGTDTGGKLATLHMMERNGGLDPDVGYWAQRYDPKGALAPLHYTYHVGDKWVNVTTLPLLYAAYPLYLVGGDRAVLLLPMLGAVGCALAARALARRLRGGDGWLAFWVVALATPVAIYALDFWEHTVGLALMLFGAVLLLDVVNRRAAWRGAFVAGVLFGAAATMRTEALVYFAVATAAVCLVVLARDRVLVRPVVFGGVALVGAAIPLVLNRLLEQATLGTDLRGARVAGTATAVASSLGNRVQEAVTTTIGVGFADMKPSSEYLIGGVMVCLVAGAAWALSSSDRRRVTIGWICLALLCVTYLARFAEGLSFVPGLLTASPFAAVGLLLAWRHPRLRGPALVACVALPVVWISQYSGGAAPQWGDRYALMSGTVLAIAGCITLRGHTKALIAVLALAVIVTGGGLAWLSVRSHTVAEGMETIINRHDEVVISRQPHMLREGGAFYDSGRHWLTATTDPALRRAVRVARESGAHELALVGAEGQSAPATIEGFVRGPTELVPFIRPDVKLGVVTYRRAR